jgi:hypothetical protein
MSAFDPRAGARDDTTLLERMLIVMVAVLFGMSLLVWLTAQAAALLSTGHPATLTLAQAAHAVPDLTHHLTQPADAFTATGDGRLPGPVPFYTAAAVMLAVLASVLLASWYGWRRLRGKASTRTGYASAGDVRRAM